MARRPGKLIAAASSSSCSVARQGKVERRVERLRGVIPGRVEQHYLGVAAAVKRHLERIGASRSTRAGPSIHSATTPAT